MCFVTYPSPCTAQPVSYAVLQACNERQLLARPAAIELFAVCAMSGYLFILGRRADAETDKSASTRGDGRRGRASKKRKEEDAPSEQPANGRKRRRAAKKDASSPAPGRPQVMQP